MATPSPSRTTASSRLPRLALVHGPTPLVKSPRLDDMLGIDLWIKRDDATGGAEAGNKVRKLEFLLADALACGADTVVTCGGLQSNHARATALACASQGLACVLVLRADPPHADAQRSCAGNVLLDRLAGAEIRLVSSAEYAERAALLEGVASELRHAGKRPYLVPEGGSNGVGSLGYVACMGEVADQMRGGRSAGERPFDTVVVACGSGGTAAGVALGAARYAVARQVRAMAVCNDAAYFEGAIARIVADTRARDGSLGDPAPVLVDDSAKGPAYAASTRAQRETIIRVARMSGLVLDPVYTGKAMHGLFGAVERRAVEPRTRVLFLHTGGLPGLLAQGDAFGSELE